MSNCVFCDQGMAVTAMQIGEMAVPGMHKVPIGSLATFKPCKNYVVRGPSEEVLADWAKRMPWLPREKVIR